MLESRGFYWQRWRLWMVDVPLRHRRPNVRAPGLRRPGGMGPSPPQVIPALRRPRWPRLATAVVIAIGAVLALGLVARLAIDVSRGSLTLTRLSSDPARVTLLISGQTMA